MPKIIEDFESGSLSSEFTTRDSRFNVESTRAYNGTYSVRMNYGDFDSGGSSAPSSANIATFVPSELSGGAQPNYLEWYWQETSGSYGGGIRVRDSAGNTVGAFLTNNPQWDVQTGSGFFTEIFSGDGVNRWIRSKMEFDYANNEITYTAEDLSSGTVVTKTYSSVNSYSDIEKIDFMDYGGGEGYSVLSQNGNGNLIEMWWDDFTVEGVGSTGFYTGSTKTFPTLVDSGSTKTFDTLPAGFYIGDTINVETAFKNGYVGRIKTLDTLGLPPGQYVGLTETFESDGPLRYEGDLILFTTQQGTGLYYADISTFRTNFGIDPSGFYSGGIRSFETTGELPAQGSVDIKFKHTIKVQRNSTVNAEFNEIRDAIISALSPTQSMEKLESGTVSLDGTDKLTKSLDLSVENPRTLKVEFRVLDEDLPESESYDTLKLETANSTRWIGEFSELSGGRSYLLSLRIKAQ